MGQNWNNYLKIQFILELEKLNKIEKYYLSNKLDKLFNVYIYDI